MRRTTTILLLVLLAGASAGCEAMERRAADTPTEAASGPAPVNLGSPVNTDSSEYNPELSEDGLTLLFSSRRPGGYGSNDLWLTTRPGVDAPWGEPQNLGPAVNTEHWETGPSMTEDGLELFFTSTKFSTDPDDVSTDARDIYVARRASVDAPFESVQRLGGEVNTPDHSESGPHVSGDGLMLIFSSDRPGGLGSRDLYVATRETRDAPFGPPQSLGPAVNSPHYDSSPSMTTDRLTLFFHTDRASDRGKHDIFVTRRTSTDAPWSEPVSVGAHINTPQYHEGTPNVSADGTLLLFRSEREGGLGHQDLWMVPLSDAPGAPPQEIRD